MVGVQSGANGATAVPGRRLDIEFIEACLAQQATVGDAVECYPAGETEAREPGLAAGSSPHRQQRLLGHRLNACRDVRVVLVLAGQGPEVFGPLAEVGPVAAGRREEVRP